MAFHCSIVTEISILAPARGATSVQAAGLGSSQQFQSSLPRGERQILLLKVSDHDDFNPRSREGSDQIRTLTMQLSNISILAPARGATLQPKLCIDPVQFQSSLPRGERQGFRIKQVGHDRFQSSLPRGERHDMRYLKQIL